MAVLPFEGVSTTPDHEYLDDDIPDTLIGRGLAFPRIFRSFARGTNFRFSNSGVDPEGRARSGSRRALKGRLPERATPSRSSQLVHVAMGTDSAPSDKSEDAQDLRRSAGRRHDIFADSGCSWRPKTSFSDQTRHG